MKTGVKITLNLGTGALLWFLILMTLRLYEIIQWSWWWIFAPFLIPIGLFILFGLIIGGILIFKLNK